MSFTIAQVKDHLIGMGHGATLKRVRNVEAMFERTAGRLLLLVHPIDVMRKTGLVSGIFDDFYNYALPYDFGDLIDLAPQDQRQLWDEAFRNDAGQFDREKAVKQKKISLEGRDGVKIIRINWRTRQPKTLNTITSTTGNGTWAALGSAINVITDTIFSVIPGGSVRFGLVASGDGIKNTTMQKLDLTTESTIANAFVSFEIPDSASLALVQSVGLIFGNDLTAKFWTMANVTQNADGTPFHVGWNTLTFPWSTAVQTGTVDPTAIDSVALSVAATGPINNLRFNNLVFAIGRQFDITYYSKFLFKSATTGLWLSRPTEGSGDDFVMLDNDSLPLYLYELLQDMAQQMEGTDATFDVQFALAQLGKLYPAYKANWPSLNKKMQRSYGGTPFRNRGNRHMRF